MSSFMLEPSTPLASLAPSEQAQSTVLSNARIVLPGEVSKGSVLIEDGLIAGIDPFPAPSHRVIECAGDYLVPGLIDLHTDNIEHHFFPRPGVQWPSSTAAVLSHDWQMLGAGVTTVLDSLSLGDYESSGRRVAMLRSAIAAFDKAIASRRLRADHYFHFRCEVSDPNLMEILEPNVDHPRLRLLSVMDHTPGQRQWRNLAIFRSYRGKKKGQTWSDEEFDRYVSERRLLQSTYASAFRERIAAISAAKRLPLASHDDTTIGDVDQSHAEGMTICEFPTTIEAAQHARRLGMRVVMGSPNIVLGRSHSGNVSAAELADQRLLDVLTSDYVPASLLHSAFLLASGDVDLHEAIAMATSGPADLLGFKDRGRIAPGLRADLLRVRVIDGVPIIVGIWTAGHQVV